MVGWNRGGWDLGTQTPGLFGSLGQVPRNLDA